MTTKNQHTANTTPRGDEAGRKPVSAKHAIAGVFLGLAVAALLSSQSLVNLATRQEVGTTRDVALNMAKGLDRLSSFFSLDRPARAISSARGTNIEEIDTTELIAAGRQNTREPAQGASETPSGTATTPQPDITAPGGGQLQGAPDQETPGQETVRQETPGQETPEQATPGQETPGQGAPPPASPSVANPASPPAPSLASPAPATSPPTFSPSPFGNIPGGIPATETFWEGQTRFDATPENPLKFWVGGDSQTLQLSNGFGRVLPTESLEYTRDPQLSSGLTRPDFLNWPQRLARLLQEATRPDVIVIMFGGNDYQDVQIDGRIVRRPSPEWLDFYRSKVVEVMDLLNQTGLDVIWVGAPIMEDEFFAEGMAHLNNIFASEATTRTSIHYFDSWTLLDNENGRYTDTIDGTLVRDIDGVHLTPSGGELVASAIWEPVASLWGLE